MTRHRRPASAWLLVLASVASLQSPPACAATAQTYPERFKACLACHGKEGLSQIPLTPSLAGLSEFYAATQLFLFREGRRDNAAMSVVAKDLTDDDLRAFSSLIGALPKPPVKTAATAAAKSPAKSPGASSRREAGLLASKYRCDTCHGGDFAGGDQVPALAWQREDYLRKALLEYKKGTRPGYQMAMADALADVPEKDLPVLAHYIASVNSASR